MRLKAVFVLLSICIAGLFGFPKYTEYTTNKSTINQIESEIETSKQTYSDLQNQSTLLLSQLQESGKDVCLNNVDMANYLATLGNITGIVARGYTDDVLGDIQMTNNIEDIAYFSSDVVQIKYDLDVADTYDFLQGLKSISTAVVDTDLDISTGKATVTVRAVTGVYTNVSNTGVNLDVPNDSSSTEYEIIEDGSEVEEVNTEL